LLALVHLTGDFSLISESGIKLQISMLDDGETSISEEQRSWVRSRTFAALRALREGPELTSPPSNTRIIEMPGFLLNRENERVDAGNREMAWGYADVRSWYENASGRITQNWPFTILEFWQQSREPNSADYDSG
jgi:hypothetical protein